MADVGSVGRLLREEVGTDRRRQRPNLRHAVLVVNLDDFMAEYTDRSSLSGRQTESGVRLKFAIDQRGFEQEASGNPHKRHFLNLH